MLVALVQEADAASSSVTLASTTAGNTVIVAVACLGSTSATGVTGITLSGNPDNFTLITPGPSAQDTTSPNDFLNVSVWADANCAGFGTAISVTGTGVVATWAFEFSGLAGMADIAQVFPVATYQDSWMASAAQTTVPAEAWFAVTAAANQTATPSPAVNSGNGWTLETAYSGTSGSYDWGALSAYQTVNTAGVPALNGSFSQPSFSVTVIVTLGAGTPPVAAQAHAPLTGNVIVRNGSMNVHGDVAAGGTVTQGGTPVALTPVGPKTGNYTANPGDFVLVDCSIGSVVVTLPAAPANGALAGVKLVNSVSGALRVNASGSDVIDAVPAGVTTIFPSPQVIGTTFVLQYQTATATWYTQSTGTALVAPALNSPQPSDAGYAAWSYDYTALAGTFTGVALTTGGKVTLVQCPVRAADTCVQVNYWITATGTGLTSSENFAGIYSSAGNLIATSLDATSQWGSTTGLATASFTGGSSFAISPPFVWVAFCCNGTTGPSFAVTGNQTAAWANGRLGTNAARFGLSAAGGHTTLPSSIPLVGGINFAAAEYWVGLS